MFQALMNIWYQFGEYYPPKSKFSVDDVPDLTGKVALVTGGYSGIGKVVAKYLLLHNATVYIAGRSQNKAGEAIEELKQITQNDKIRFLPLDLGDLISVKEAAEQFLQSGDRLDMLYNNAGVAFLPLHQLTKQGYDITFGTNVIGPAYFTILLIPALISSAKTAKDGKVRLINVSSAGHWIAPKGGVDWTTVVGSNPERLNTLTLVSAYTQSKWANIVFSNELARRYGNQGIVCTSLSPGIIRTELTRHEQGKSRSAGLPNFDADPEGALTALYAGTSPETLDMGGRYFRPFARVGVARKDTNDEELCRKMWEFVEQAAKQIA
ncbi:NAD-binding protein [Calocera viscosa TUFC12733]|uniref:NAD-binding protein n=1 Tax=Calocera viscosa (strain TUFC12733) TaxID=1330018 RepID=A0A167KHC6_CALVF|nr:NAD-binding protein [Calocera viscosa TUFC12733]